MAQIEIRYEPEQFRTAAYDGATCVGECVYTVPGDYWVIQHTGVDENYGGLGIAADLVAEVVKQARDAQVKVMPLCSYAAKQFDKHPDYQDIQLT